jgi:1,2-diacylglycerol 3-alpha-glucosyltransferase
MLHPSLTLRGGAERQLLTLATEIQKFGHEVEIFTCAVNESCYSDLAQNLKIHLVNTPYSKTVQTTDFRRTFSTRLARRLQGYTTELPSMFMLAKEVSKGFDVINNQNSPTQWAAFFAKKKLKAPIVWNCNEPPFYYSDPRQQRGLGKLNLPLYRGFDRVAVNYIDCIVSVSNIDSQRIQKAYGRSSVIVRPGIKADLLHKATGKEIRAKLGLENDFILLQVGNIAYDKRQVDSLMALHYLAKKWKNVKLIIVGQGPKNQIITLSKKLNIENRIIVLQNCSEEELAEVYAASDVFVFPSQITWGLVVVEAMVAAKPVIVSTKAGASEIIKEGQNGFLIEEPYPKSMAEKIEKLIANPELCRAVGNNAFEYAKENLSWEIYAKKMLCVYQQAINIVKRKSRL